MVRAMTKRFGRLGTALIAVAVLAMGSGLVAWASDPAGGGSSEGHISSFTVEEGDGYWDGNIYKIAIGGNLKLLATCDCSSNDSHTITITGPGWAADTSAGGVTSHTVGLKACDTAGKFTCTATCTEGGSKELTVYVFEVTSVSFDKSKIAAGGVASAVHQSEITIQLNPTATFNQINIKLEYGEGYKGGIKPYPDAPQYTYGGNPVPAELEIDGKTLKNEGTPPEETISCDAEGKRVGTLTSSNLIGDKSKVTVTVGAGKKSESIPFKKSAYEIEVPEYLGSAFDLKMTVAFDGEAVDGHKIKFYPKEITEYTKEKDGDGNDTGKWKDEAVAQGDIPTKIAELTTGTWPEEKVTGSDGIATKSSGRKAKSNPAVIKFEAFDNTALEAE